MRKVDALLADEETVPCILLMEGLVFGPHFSSYMKNKTIRALNEGSIVNLPLWLASKLHERNIVEIQTPKIFDKEIQKRIDSGALSVDLRNLSPYYFTVGNKIATLTKDDQLRKCLRAAMAGERYEKILDWSQNAAAHTDIDSLLEILTEEEREIFYDGYTTAQEHAQMRSRQHIKFNTSDVFAKSSKIKKKAQGDHLQSSSSSS
uniref:GINS subunit domain-containing protein n=1 Tax=Aureoumbra lagunensis TaxID=44058 RepID=A0A6S8AHR6_9STRA|mmetsp:Transcript_7402/g.10290  ORF Transcript_7402/g.10290 Transcript_7402/m.10290 type:complete len:205 (-) Transcript_7402:71-685(-)